MRLSDTRITSAVASLSRMLGRRIDVSADAIEGDATVVSRALPGVSRVAIRDLDGKAFTTEQRDLLIRMCDLILDDAVAKAEVAALEQRLHVLERENIALSMKIRALTDVSSRDPLTGLYNRGYLLEKIEAEMGRCLRHGNPMTLVLLDIDHFRSVNDEHGQSAGDQVLQHLGELLRDSCRIYDIPGRYGGEEFCVMLPETTLERTMPVAERVRSRIESARIHHADSSIGVTASIGIAGLESVPDAAVFSPTSLIERAERAVGVAKDRGRNRVELWSASQTARVEA